MYTSYYARQRRIPPELEPVAISLGVPFWAGKIRRYAALAPTAAMRSLSLARMLTAYQRQLAALDPAKVARDLGTEAVLLCWEAPGYLCHRRIVASWLEIELAVTVPEFGFPPELIPPWQEAPLKGQTVGLPWSVACDHCRAEIEVALTATRVRCPRCKRMVEVTLA